MEYNNRVICGIFHVRTNFYENLEYVFGNLTSPLRHYYALPCVGSFRDFMATKSFCYLYAKISVNFFPEFYCTWCSRK